MIYEDPDELGYSTTPPGSLAACNAIMPFGVQHAIEQAAEHAHRGVLPFVTAWRKQAGYDVLAGGFKALGTLYPRTPNRPPHGGYPDA